MTTRPLVSICISAYNHEAYVEDCVRAIMAQTYQPIELIVTNDGSADRTGEILRDLQQEFGFVFIDQANQGYTASLNNMIFNHAHGEYLLTSVGTDDVMLPEMVAVLMDRILAGSDVVTPGYSYIDEHGKVSGQDRYRKPVPPMNFHALFNQRRWPASGCMLTRRQYLVDAGGFDPNKRLEDLYMLLKLAHAGYAIDSVARPLFLYRKHSANQSANPRFMLEHRIRIYEDYRNAPGANRVLQRMYYSAVRRLLKRAQPQDVAFVREVFAKMQWTYQPLRYVFYWLRLRHTDAHA